MAVERGDVKKAGERIYMARVMWKLNDSDKGKMVVIDVDSGDYEVDADEAVALERLLARRPDARAWPVKFQGQHVFRGGWRLTYGRLSFDDEATVFIKKLNSGPNND